MTTGSSDMTQGAVQVPEASDSILALLGSLDESDAGDLIKALLLLRRSDRTDKTAVARRLEDAIGRAQAAEVSVEELRERIKTEAETRQAHTREVQTAMLVCSTLSLKTQLPATNIQVSATSISYSVGTSFVQHMLRPSYPQELHIGGHYTGFYVIAVKDEQRSNQYDGNRYLFAEDQLERAAAYILQQQPSPREEQ